MKIDDGGFCCYRCDLMSRGGRPHPDIKYPRYMFLEHVDKV